MATWRSLPMKKTFETIVFFGSGPVAAESLRLLAQGFTIEAVVTKPRPAHHRGDVPVISAAKELNIPTHTVTNRNALNELVTKKPFQSRLGILIDFGIIVSQKVIDYFPLGILNSHFSILPDLRGADPITFAILSGQEMTGVSLMLLVEAMDEGPLLAYGEQPLDGTETTPELTHRLIALSDALLRDRVPQYFKEQKTAPQDITGRIVSYSRKLTKNDGSIDWSKPAEQIEREVRAFIDWPKSRTTIARKDVVITKASAAKESGQPGTMMVRGKQLIAYCGKGSLILEQLKPAGKNEMTIEAFLAGHKNLLA